MFHHPDDQPPGCTAHELVTISFMHDLKGKPPVQLCTNCDGFGEVEDVCSCCSSDEPSDADADCDDCWGTGLIDAVCPDCHGEGFVEVES